VARFQFGVFCGTAGTCRHNDNGKFKKEKTSRMKIQMCGTGADQFVVAIQYCKKYCAKKLNYSAKYFVNLNKGGANDSSKTI
jgi:hypothetical protein